MSKGGVAVQGGKLERAIIPTVLIPPTGDDLSQALPLPGYPEPVAGNRSVLAGVTAEIIGALRQDADSDPTIRVRIEDSGRVQLAQTDRAIIEAIFPEGTDPANFSAADLIRPRLQVPRMVAVGVPRLSIERSNYDQIPGGDDNALIGIRTSFELRTEIDPQPPTEAPGSWACLATAPMLDDQYRNLLICFVATDGATNHLVVKLYDPAVSHDLQDFASVDLNAMFPDMAGALDVAPFRRGAEFLVAISCTFSAGGAGCVFAQITGSTPDNAQISHASDGFGAGTGLPVRIAACDTAGGVVVAVRELTSTIRFARSDDLRAWDIVSSDSALVRFGESALVASLSGTVNDMARDRTPDGSPHFWACTTRGEVYHGFRNVRAWVRQLPPTVASKNASGLANALYSVASAGSHVWAVGGGGLVIKSENYGSTWKVISYTAAKPTDVFREEDLEGTPEESGLPGVTLRKVRALDANRLWVVGDGALVAYSPDGGATWTEVQYLASKGAYLDFIVDDAASGNVLIAVGTADVHDAEDVPSASDRRTRAVVITDAETAEPGKTYLLPPTTSDGDPLVSITTERNDNYPDPTASNQRSYVLSASGVIHRLTGSGAGSVATAQIAALQPSGTFSDIECPNGESAKLRIAGPYESVSQGGGYFWICDDADQATPAFAPQPVGIAPTALLSVTADQSAIGGRFGIVSIFGESNQREHPALFTHPETGWVLLGCANVSRGWMEIYRAPRPAPGALPHFQLVDNSVTFAIGAAGNSPKISFALCPDGSVCASMGVTHRFGYGDGRRWLPPSDPNVPIGVDDIAADAPNDYLVSNKSLRGASQIFWHRGRLWRTAPTDGQDAIGVFTAWEWSAAGTEYPPIIAGKPVWLGVDDVHVVFHGAPLALDEWIVQPRYGYGADRLVTPSQSVVYRSKTFEPDEEEEVILPFDRQSERARNALDGGVATGAPKLWHFNAAGIICNVKTVEFQISDPTNDASFTTKQLDLTVYSGSADGPGGLRTTNVLIDPDANFTPGEYNRGERIYRVDIAGTVAIVLANTERALILDRSVTLPALPLGPVAYDLFVDRACWFGTGGTGPGTAGLAGTAYEFGRHVNVRIPAQATAEGYYEIRALALGVDPQATADHATVRSFQSLEFSDITNTLSSQADSGVKSVTHVGEDGRVWLMGYVHELPEEVLARVAYLYRMMRRPFMLCFNGPTDFDAIEWVRKVDASKYTMTMTEGRFSHISALERIV